MNPSYGYPNQSGSGVNNPSNFTNNIGNPQIFNPWGVTPYGFINQTPQVPGAPQQQRPRGIYDATDTVTNQQQMGPRPGFGQDSPIEEFFSQMRRTQMHNEMAQNRYDMKYSPEAIQAEAQQYAQMNQNRPYQDYQQSVYDQVNNWQDWSYNGMQQLEQALGAGKASYAQKNNIPLDALSSIYTPGHTDIAPGAYSKQDLLEKIMPASTGWGENEWIANLQERAARGNPLQGFGRTSTPTNNSISYNANPYGMNIASMYNIPSAYGQGPWSNSMWG
jgi:hypothetical protein